MPKYRQNELKFIHQDYLSGREMIDAGLLEDAIPFFDRVLIYLPRRRRDRIYRFAGPATPPKKDGTLWLPTVFRDALLAKVYCLNELGRFTDAYSLLERAIELDPENPQVYAEIGFAYGALDNLEMARMAYARALELEPENPAHLRALAHLALLAEDFDDALSLAQRALALEPDSVHSLHQLAFARYSLGNLDGAIRTLERAREIDPYDHETVLRLVGSLREAGRIREAIIRVDHYLQHDSADPETLGIMTDLLQQDGTAPEIFSHVQRLLARNPRDPSALALQAWGYYQHGQMTEALEVLRRLIPLEPLQAHHHFKLGMVHEALGNLPLAMASLLRANVIGKDDEVGQMASEAIHHLDQVQIEQLIMRMGIDPLFRARLQREPEQTLLQSGYLLSPLGLQMLLSFDLSRDGEAVMDLRARTVH